MERMIEFEQYRLNLVSMEEEISELRSALGIQKDMEELAELEKKTMDPGFYADIEASQKVLQKIKKIKDKIGGYDLLYKKWEDAKTLVELAMEEGDDSVFDEVKATFEELSKSLEQMKLDALLSGQYDKHNAIITVHAGAGGTEAQDWAQMLLRMYIRFAERRGFKTTTLDYLDGDEAGIKSASILIEGLNAYGYLKCEKGVHRLVRISPFDASGRRHTSFASLDVTPDIDDEIDVKINPDDLRVDVYRASGAGGQHVNKTSSAVRITHIPTGIVVSCQNERSQHQNREYAMKMLKAKLVEIAEREQKEKIEDIKGVQKEIAWGSQIRSYVFHPYSMVKDHRTNYETGNTAAVMDGEIDGFINAFLKAANLGELNLK